jgi:hypothetical protein
MSKTKRSQADFENLTDALAKEAQGACIDYRLYRDVQDACCEFATVTRQSPAFWDATVNAHLNSAILRLCRIYDTHKKTLNLARWLTIIKDNREWFADKEFERRTGRQRQHSESGVLKSEVDAEIRLAQPSNRLVKNLLKLRNNIVAHAGEDFALLKDKGQSAIELTLGDLETLAGQALGLVNKYLAKYKSHTYSGELIGKDDFRFVFTRLHESVCANTSVRDSKSDSPGEKASDGVRRGSSTVN